MEAVTWYTPEEVEEREKDTERGLTMGDSKKFACRTKKGDPSKVRRQYSITGAPRDWSVAWCLETASTLGLQQARFRHNRSGMSYLLDAVADRSLVSNSLQVTDIVNEVERNFAGHEDSVWIGQESAVWWQT